MGGHRPDCLGTAGATRLAASTRRWPGVHGPENSTVKRTVPLPLQLVHALEEHKEQQEERIAAGSLAGQSVRVHHPDRHANRSPQRLPGVQETTRQSWAASSPAPRPAPHGGQPPDLLVAQSAGGAPGARTQNRQIKRRARPGWRWSESVRTLGLLCGGPGGLVRCRPRSFSGVAACVAASALAPAGFLELRITRVFSCVAHGFKSPPQLHVRRLLLVAILGY